MQTEAQRRATKKYHDKHERIYILITAEDKAKYADHAASQGESLSAFVKRALDEALERDLAK